MYSTDVPLDSLVLNDLLLIFDEVRIMEASKPYSHSICSCSSCWWLWNSCDVAALTPHVPDDLWLDAFENSVHEHEFSNRARNLPPCKPPLQHCKQAVVERRQGAGKVGRQETHLDPPLIQGFQDRPVLMGAQVVHKKQISTSRRSREVVHPPAHVLQIHSRAPWLASGSGFVGDHVQGDRVPVGRDTSYECVSSSPRPWVLLHPWHWICPRCVRSRADRGVPDSCLVHDPDLGLGHLERYLLTKEQFRPMELETGPFEVSQRFEGSSLLGPVDQVLEPETLPESEGCVDLISEEIFLVSGLLAELGRELGDHLPRRETELVQLLGDPTKRGSEATVALSCDPALNRAASDWATSSVPFVDPLGHHSGAISGQPLPSAPVGLSLELCSRAHVRSSPDPESAVIHSVLVRDGLDPVDPGQRSHPLFELR